MAYLCDGEWYQENENGMMSEDDKMIHPDRKKKRKFFNHIEDSKELFESQEQRFNIENEINQHHEDMVDYAY